MPATKFRCPDGVEHPILDCLESCRMEKRCVPTPYLHQIAFDREWRGITPSQAGNGPLQIVLKAVCEYTIDPQDRAFAVLGVHTHATLSLHEYNVFSEEKLSDDQMQGIPDLLEEIDGGYLLSDWKTWGSFKVAKALGLVSEDEPILGEDGEPILLKSGKNKGQPKTQKVWTINPECADIKSETLQLNKYRQFFQKAGFPIKEIQINAIVRDGGTYIAQSRGIDKNLYIIPVPIVPDLYVDSYYAKLIQDTNNLYNNFVRREDLFDNLPETVFGNFFCGKWECWDGRRCEGFCEVSEQCKKLGRPDNWRGK